MLFFPILFSCAIFVVLSVINAVVKLSRVFVSHPLAFEPAALITFPSSSCTLLTFFLTPPKKKKVYPSKTSASLEIGNNFFFFS